MTFPLDEIVLGPNAYGMRKGTEMVVLHTPSAWYSCTMQVTNTQLLEIIGTEHVQNLVLQQQVAQLEEQLRAHQCPPCECDKDVSPE